MATGTGTGHRVRPSSGSQAATVKTSTAVPWKAGPHRIDAKGQWIILPQMHVGGRKPQDAAPGIAMLDPRIDRPISPKDMRRLFRMASPQGVADKSMGQLPS